MPLQTKIRPYASGDIVLSADEVALIKSSYDQMWKNREKASLIFYDRLFDIAPDTKALFKGDMDVQRRQFMAALGHIVTDIEKPEIVYPAIKATALKHVEYGVRPHHYEPVGEALVWTVDKLIGADAASVWETAYAEISRIMRSEAYPPEV